MARNKKYPNYDRRLKGSPRRKYSGNSRYENRPKTRKGRKIYYSDGW